MAMNGTTAGLTEGTPSSADAARWAPFTLLAAAPGDTLHLSEDLAKVRNSLPAQMLRTPFRWLFDDGGSAQGYTVTHTFRQLGWHRITVQYFYPARNEWIAFDSARLHIVSSGTLFWTNLPHYASAIVLLVLRAVVWIVLGIVALALVADWLRRWRRDRAAGPAGGEG